MIKLKRLERIRLVGNDALGPDIARSITTYEGDEKDETQSILKLIAEKFANTPTEKVVGDIPVIAHDSEKCITM